MPETLPHSLKSLADVDDPDSQDPANGSCYRHDVFLAQADSASRLVNARRLGRVASSYLATPDQYTASGAGSARG